MSVNALVSLQRLNDEDGFRWYKLGDDPPEKWFISVTEVLNVAVDKRLQSYMQRTSAAQQEKTKETTTSIGTELHEIIEKDALGLLDEPVRDTLKPAFGQWLKLKEEHHIHANACEFGVFSRKHGYSGTADLLGTVDGKRALIDVKSGWVGPKVGWQIAAYHNAMLEMEGPQELNMMCVQVKRDGSQANLFRYTHVDWCLQRFLDCLGVWRGLYYRELDKRKWEWLHIDRT